MITLGSTLLFNISSGTGPISLDEVQCNGTECRLIDCLHLPLAEHNCSHSYDVGVRCLSSHLVPGGYL